MKKVNFKKGLNFKKITVSDLTEINKQQMQKIVGGEEYRTSYSKVCVTECNNYNTCGSNTKTQLPM